jgi:hypothetical protein
MLSSWVFTILAFSALVAGIPIHQERDSNLQKRLVHSCSGNPVRQAIVAAALSKAEQHAAFAAGAALSGSAATFKLYFKTADPLVRTLVATRFTLISTLADPRVSEGFVYYCDAAHVPKSISTKDCSKPRATAVAYQTLGAMFNVHIHPLPS